MGVDSTFIVTELIIYKGRRLEMTGAWMKSRHFFLSYAPHRMDPVFIVAYVPGNFFHFSLVFYPPSKKTTAYGRG